MAISTVVEHRPGACTIGEIGHCCLVLGTVCQHAARCNRYVPDPCRNCLARLPPCRSCNELNWSEHALAAHPQLHLVLQPCPLEHGSLKQRLSAYLRCIPAAWRGLCRHRRNQTGHRDCGRRGFQLSRMHAAVAQSGIVKALLKTSLMTSIGAAYKLQAHLLRVRPLALRCLPRSRFRREAARQTAFIPIDVSPPIVNETRKPYSSALARQFGRSGRMRWRFMNCPRMSCCWWSQSRRVMTVELDEVAATRWSRVTAPQWSRIQAGSPWSGLTVDERRGGPCRSTTALPRASVTDAAHAGGIVTAARRTAPATRREARRRGTCCCGVCWHSGRSAVLPPGGQAFRARRAGDRAAGSRSGLSGRGQCPRHQHARKNWHKHRRRHSHVAGPAAIGSKLGCTFRFAVGERLELGRIGEGSAGSAFPVFRLVRSARWLCLDLSNSGTLREVGERRVSENRPAVPVDLALRSASPGGSVGSLRGQNRRDYQNADHAKGDVFRALQ